MIRYADPTRCPDCGAEIPAQPTACAGCGLPLRGHDAAVLFRTLQAADQQLGALRASALVPSPSAAPSPAARSLPDLPSDLPPRTPSSPSPTPRTGLAGASVPKILLSLGALCLLVAAITFLAVAWSWLGVGGRTVVLVGLTVIAGATATWLGRRGLRWAAEALSVVAFGLLALDVIGADHAGWLGDLSAAGLVAVTGVVVGVVALALAWLTNRGGRTLLAPQAFAGLGLGVVPAGLSGTTGHDEVVFALACVTLLGLAAATHRLAIGWLPWIFGALAALWWFPLSAAALVRMVEHPTGRELWLERHAWPALCSAGLLLVAAYGVRRFAPWPQFLAGVAASVLTVTVVFPGLDGSLTQVTLTWSACAVAWSLALLAVPTRWLVTPTIPLVVSAIVPTFSCLLLATTAVDSMIGVHPAWGSPASLRIDPLPREGWPGLLVVTTLVAGLVLVALSRLLTTPLAFARALAPFLTAAVALAGVGTLTWYAVPWALVPAGVLLVAGGLLGWGLRRTDTRGTAALASALVLGLAALLTALPSVVLTLATMLVLLTGAVLVAVRAAEPAARLVGEILVAPAAAVAVEAVAELAGLDPVWRGVPVLLVVGGMALARPRLPIEVPAAVAGFVASAASVAALVGLPGDHGALPLEVHLTVAGVLVTASALIHPHRRLLSWPGGLLLVLASWVRLADLGVTAPEAYTLPAAVALLVVGLRRLRLDEQAGTMSTLTPGLSLATVPSLLWILGADPVSWRALLLGLGCLALVLAGTRLRWSSPLVVGALVGGTLVLREAGPYAAQLPPWMLIAFAGTILTVVGVTWESRLRNLRDASAYLSRLR